MKHFVVFANCIPIKGYRRSMIYDLQRYQLYPIPNELFHILNYEYGNELNDLYSKFPKYEDIINEYFNFLEDKEIIFYTDSKEETNFFPSLNFEWDYPGLVIDAIVELNDDNYGELINFIPQIEQNGGRFLELRFLGKDYNSIEKFLSSMQTSAIRTIDLYILNDGFDTDELKQLYFKNNRIHKITVLSLDNKRTDVEGIYFVQEIEWGENNIVKRDSMIVNMKYFMESQYHNTYLNRKIFVNADGIIKNAPKSDLHLGRIEDVVINEINFDEVNKLTKITKDKIDVCKDCEFRYACFDQRIPIIRENSTWYHLIECNYNPYICKWKDEEGYQTLEEIGVISNENGFSINHEKIATINKILWEEET